VGRRVDYKELRYVTYNELLAAGRRERDDTDQLRQNYFRQTQDELHSVVIRQLVS